MKRKAISVVGVVCAGLAIWAPNVARADSLINFDISGTATALAGQSCATNCAITGTMTVDVTTGTVSAISVSLPGLATFDTLSTAQTFGNDYDLILVNGPQDFAFTFTAGTPPSLVGFMGGSLTGGGAVTLSTNDSLYNVTSGTIAVHTNVVTNVTPEPSSLLLLGTGFAGVVGSMRRRIRRS